MARKALRTGLASAPVLLSLAIDIIDRDGTRWHKCRHIYVIRIQYKILHVPTRAYHFQTRSSILPEPKVVRKIFG